MASNASTSRSNLGSILRSIREKNNWRIADVSKMTGLAVSTISKVENNQMSLTYDKLIQLANGLSLDLADLFAERSSQTAPAMVTGRRSIGRKNDGVSISAGFYEYLYLNADLARKGMVPIIGETRARTLAEFGDLISHEGEEFLFVLEGDVEVHTEYYQPTLLSEGDYIYFDSAMGHAYISKSFDRARFLVVCSGSASEEMLDALRAQTGDPAS
ncbi:helix-turn-helix domain-containing protein [Hyphococcus sp.]|uniref:helix-turn-helix domain-containing protein n=1 Tax=Hyphococcus sp. TaxID=2038636 RepID=UPI003CCC1226